VGSTTPDMPSEHLFIVDSPLEGTGFEPSVPPQRERLWAATPGKHCRFGPEPVSGSAFRAAVADWQRPEERFAGAGPMVRIRFPPAASLLRTAGEGARPELGQTFKLTPDQRTEESHSTTTI
jgi:hypothetical protein